MTDPNQIPFLVKLLDDESVSIQRTIFEELDAFGPLLKDEVRKIPFPLTTRQKENLECIFDRHQRSKLLQFWPTWFHIKDSYQRMEAALTLIGEYQTIYDYDTKLKDMLDRLAQRFKNQYHSKDPRLLAKFLFDDIGMKGNDEDYYNPQNSNPFYVINEKKGIPISLVAIYMLVGYRLGIKIEGCPFPGHFLARIYVHGQSAYVDCYSSGQIILEDDFIRAKDEISENFMETLSEKVNTELMLRRYLANLIRSYQINEDHASSDLMVRLFTDLDIRLSNRQMADITPEDIISGFKPQFQPGNVVIHSRYGYRGIIVDMDFRCKATDEWYYSNQSQPSRDQSWYHILVDDSEQVTYVAENNLEADDINKDIEHPLLTYFFVKTKEGCYIRNDNAWPETDF